MSELQIDELWLIFANEALSYLKRDISPSDLEIADWKASTYEQIIKLSRVSRRNQRSNTTTEKKPLRYSRRRSNSYP